MEQNNKYIKAIGKVVSQLFNDNILLSDLLNTSFQGKRITCHEEFWVQVESKFEEGKRISSELLNVLIAIREVSNRKIEVYKIINESSSKLQHYKHIDILRCAAALNELSSLKKQLPMLSEAFIPSFDRFGVLAFQNILDDLSKSRNEIEISLTRQGIIDLLLTWELFIQLEYLNEMEDALINGMYFLDKINGSIQINSAVNENPEVQEELKHYYRKQILSRLSKEKVSAEKQFLTNDGKYKTHEGILTSMTSEGSHITDQAPGTTSMAVNELTETDELGNVNLSLEAGLTVMHQHHLYNYRNELQNHFIPKEEDDIKQLFVEIPEMNNDHVNVHLFIALGSWLTAFSINMKNHLFVENDIRISRLFKWIEEQANLKTPLSLQDANGILVDYLSGYDALIDKKGKVNLHDNMLTLTETELINLLSNNEDLKDEVSSTKLLEVAKYMALKKYSGLYHIEGKFYLLPRLLSGYDSLSNFYNNVILKQLYSDTISRKTEIATNHTNREKIICTTLAQLFVDNGFLAKADIDFAYGTIYPGDLRGQFDVIAVDQKNKLILTIEVKLKNTHIATRLQKNQWREDKILGLKGKRGAIQQVDGYLKYFRQSDCGKALIKDLFGIDSIKGYKVLPLIVTDNFFFDHQKIEIPSFDGENVQIVSFFELKMLLKAIEPFDYKFPNWAIYHLNKILEKSPENIEAREHLEKIHPAALQLSKETIAFIDKNKINFWENAELGIGDILSAIENETYWSFLKWFPVSKGYFTTTRFVDNITMHY